jgi:hypothetical protein
MDCQSSGRTYALSPGLVLPPARAGLPPGTVAREPPHPLWPGAALQSLVDQHLLHAYFNCQAVARRNWFSASALLRVYHITIEHGVF